jgi:hypothetical protein
VHGIELVSCAAPGRIEPQAWFAVRHHCRQIQRKETAALIRPAVGAEIGIVFFACGGDLGNVRWLANTYRINPDLACDCFVKGGWVRHQRGNTSG